MPILSTTAGSTVDRAPPPIMSDVLTGDEHGGVVFEAPLVIACAGLQSDRIAALDGVGDDADDGIRIVPFKQVYYSLPSGRFHDRLQHLVYECPRFDRDLREEGWGTYRDVPLIRAARFVRGLNASQPRGRGSEGVGTIELGGAGGLSFAREFYSDVETATRFEYERFRFHDFFDIVTWPGCWRAAVKLNASDVIEQLRDSVSSVGPPRLT